MPSTTLTIHYSSPAALLLEHKAGKHTHPPTIKDAAAATNPLLPRHDRYPPRPRHRRHAHVPRPVVLAHPPPCHDHLVAGPHPHVDQGKGVQAGQRRGPRRPRGREEEVPFPQQRYLRRAGCVPEGRAGGSGLPEFIGGSCACGPLCCSFRKGENAEVF